jgi:1-acylglycerone phosphate reductase
MDTDIEAAKKMFNVNVFGLVAVTEAFSHMLVSSKGRVVNIGSVVAKSPVPWQGMYNATKAAVQSISDNMRIEMAPLGVKVIHVSCGCFGTGACNYLTKR